jgi:hypothetical protein
MAIEIADLAPVDQPLFDAAPLPRPNDSWTRVRRRGQQRAVDDAVVPRRRQA